jgi:hypothetical protein
MNDNLISFFILFNVKTRLVGFLRLQLKSIAPPLLNLHIQSVPRLIDKVAPIFNEPPNFVIRTSCVLAREIQAHHHHLRPAPVSG